MKTTPAYKTALTGLLAALTLAVSFLERAVTATLPLPPGVRLGLSNVVVTFCCVELGLPYALAIILIKAGAVLLVSGPVAGFISVSGGVLSVLAAFAVKKLLGERVSYFGICILSAFCHNAGQLLAASAIVGSMAYLASAPLLLLAGIVCGAVTGAVLTAVGPAMKGVLPRLMMKKDKR